MAGAYPRKSAYELLKLCSSLMRISKLSTTAVKAAIYPPHYQQPTLNKEELAKPLDESDPRKFQPIRAAGNQHSSSVYYDDRIQKFTSMMIKGGNRGRVQDIMERTLENIKRIQVEKFLKSNPEDQDNIVCNPVNVVHRAIDNCQPALILTRIVKGGVAYQVPTSCKPKYSNFKAMKWLIESCRDKERKIPMERKLAYELLDAFHGEGKSVRKKQELHKQCVANRAYAHYRW